MSITIAKLLNRNEFDVCFVVIGKEIGEIQEFIPRDYPVRLIRIRNIFDFTTIRVFSLLRRLRPDYVFCSLVYLAPRVICAARMGRHCKVIIRWNCAVDRVAGITRFLIRKTLHKADVVIAQTEFMQNEIEKGFPLSRGKVITLHNLLDIDIIDKKINNSENPYKNEQNKVIIWIGRFDPIKRIETLVRAFNDACSRHESLSLYLVGKIDEKNLYYQYISTLVKDTEIQEKIHFVGFQDNPYKWIKYADCFVLSSRSEASPNALFEALYLGTPSVSTRCTPNIDDIIQDGVNGFKVDVDNFLDMSDKLLRGVELGRVESIYNHSSKEEFLALFQ